MLRHKRVSGNPNESPDKLGGENWDEPHVYPIGSIFLYGIVELFYQSGIRLAMDPHGGVVDANYDFVGGSLTIQIDVAALPIPISASVAPVVISQWTSLPSLNYRFDPNSFDSVTGNIIMDSMGSSGDYEIIAADFGVICQVYLKVIAP